MLATSGRRNHVQYRSEERVAFVGQRAGNERQLRGGNASAVPVRIPQFRHAAACDVTAITIWDRRSRAIRVFLGRPPPPRWTRVVAGLAAWAHRLWKFAVPVTVFVCRQWSAHQPRVPHLGWTAKGE